MLTWLGLVGAWLLVAGSIFQAMLELRAYDLVRERIGICAREVALPRLSAWWWLLPPVRYFLARIRSKRLYVAVMARLAPADVLGFVDLFDKTIGWSLVAGGGLLLAAKETLVITGNLHLGRIAAAAVTLVCIASCIGIARLRLVRSQAIARDYATPGD